LMMTRFQDMHTIIQVGKVKRRVPGVELLGLNFFRLIIFLSPDEPKSSFWSTPSPGLTSQMAQKTIGNPSFASHPTPASD
jgi:hypothetical protein